MSYQSIFRSSVDSGLRERIIACTIQEAWNNPTASETEFGRLVKETPNSADRMVWAVCIASDVEAAYLYALDTGVINPGGNPAVVTDGMIIANVQAKWPPDPAP